MDCLTCGTPSSVIECPDGNPACEILHTGCSKCAPIEKDIKELDRAIEGMRDRSLKLEMQEKQERATKSFSGKTIRDVERQGCNTWTFQFTDGTEQKIWAEVAVSTPFGSIPGIFLDGEL